MTHPPLLPRDLEAFRLDVAGEDLVVLVIGQEPVDRAGRLTPAEREVVALAAKGLSNAEIAAARGTSARTVANQIARACEKVGASSRVELVARLAAG